MKLILLVIVLFTLTGCADSMTFEEASNAALVGFWHGIWHGFIIIFSLVGSFFSDDIAIYAIYNNGALYDLGFFLGIVGDAIGIHLYVVSLSSGASIDLLADE